VCKIDICPSVIGYIIRGLAGQQIISYCAESSLCNFCNQQPNF